MKRGAESYITKDSEPDDEIEEIPEEGFRKAEEAVLATRKIRALPKRSMANTPPPATANKDISPPESSSSPVPKFNGFSGFGTPSGSFPSSLTLNSTSNTSSPSFSFPVPTHSSLSITPVVAPTASSTAKTFASFLSDTSATQPKPSAQVPMPQDTPLSASQTSSTGDSAALKYYKSLRGLNLSLLSAITKAIEDDPFNNMAEVLERYKSLRMNAQNEFDERPKVPTPKPPGAPSKSTIMPVPPSTFSGFGPQNPKPAISPSNGGFVPTLPATTSSTPGFTFSLPTSGVSSNTPATSSSNPFTPDPSTPTAFNTSMFNSSTSSAFGTSLANKFSPAPSVGNNIKTTPTNNPFGTLSPNITTTPDKPGPSSLFGAPPPQPKSNTFGGFGGFGNSGGSIGNPVGFGFGGPPETPTESGGTGITEKVDDTRDQNAENEAKSSPMSSMLTSVHDEEGEGEEQEDTIYSVKLKAYRLKKEDEKGGTGWAELGYGVLRLKKHKETEARRMLLRNSSSGKININFNIYSGLKPSQVKKTLTFIGHDNGVSQTYNVRLQNEEQASKLKEALEKEIASVKLNSTPRTLD